MASEKTEQDAYIKQVLSWPLATRQALLPLLQKSVLFSCSMITLGERIEKLSNGSLVALLKTAEIVDVDRSWLVIRFPKAPLPACKDASASTHATRSKSQSGTVLAFQSAYQEWEKHGVKKERWDVCVRVLRSSDYKRNQLNAGYMYRRAEEEADILFDISYFDSFCEEDHSIRNDVDALRSWLLGAGVVESAAAAEDMSEAFVLALGELMPDWSKFECAVLAALEAQ